MKKKDRKSVSEVIEVEGFDHTFRYYDSFLEIEDEKFHQLRKAYLKAAKDLEKYIGDEFRS